MAYTFLIRNSFYQEFSLSAQKILSCQWGKIWLFSQLHILFCILSFCVEVGIKLLLIVSWPYMRFWLEEVLPRSAWHVRKGEKNIDKQFLQRRSKSFLCSAAGLRQHWRVTWKQCPPDKWHVECGWRHFIPSWGQAKGSTPTPFHQTAHVSLRSESLCVMTRVSFQYRSTSPELWKIVNAKNNPLLVYEYWFG